VYFQGEVGLLRSLVAVVVAAGCHHDPASIGDSRAPRVCPAHLDLSLIGASSRFDPGWSGAAHGIGLDDGSSFSVDVTDCDPECRRCRFRGPVRGDPSAPVVSQRCLDDVSRTCDDQNACSTGACRFMFPPISANVVVPSCVIAYFEPLTGLPDPSPVQGVIDLVSGEADLSLLNIYITASINGLCENCIGADVSPNDGVKGGMCEKSGKACDVNGTGTLKPASTTSYDCPPPAGTLTIALPMNGTATSNRAWTMSTTRPKCTATSAGTKSCWCGMCRDGSTCIEDHDCAVGSCGASAGPPPKNIAYSVANNSCTDAGGDACVWNASTQRGHCKVMTNKPCFPDTGTMFARGEAQVGDGFYVIQLANIVCMPAFSDGSPLGNLLDGASGFPGPFLYEARFRVDPRGAR
jgi:hypothetical protein